ncbi:Isochorismatase hydrolase [Obba rivulosa]|uniref:Isochorismatase hydrolase n=1 Tax=Obba rivulosa TaxID=1052685 RepID=A0A8E2APC4_9APHY|nr:Isochorismatase hydrolase [Obba rivulosa]
MNVLARLEPETTVFLMCDIQTRFRNSVHEFDAMVSTAAKMLAFAPILEIPVIATEQNPRALGPTVPELDLSPLGDLHLGTFPKTLFSMAIPPVLDALHARNTKAVVLFGIEAHVCVAQTALDLLSEGFAVHVLADGVSSANAQETPVALARLCQAGATVTTSEAAVFELMADSARPHFKAFSAAIKATQPSTRTALNALMPRSAL